MTTVAQMIEYLKTLPQDAQVQCGYETSSGYSTCMEMCDVDINSTRIFDFTSKENRKNAGNLAGKVIVEIRGE